MNRLQKKCIIAAAGSHLLLFVILLVGPAFLSSHNKTDDSQVIDFIPANLVDGNFSGGGGPKSPTPPPAAPPAPPQPVAQQPVAATTPPPTPQKVADPVKPTPTPTPVVKEQAKVEKSKPDPDSLTPTTKPVKPKPEISTTLVTRSKTDSTAAAAHAKDLADAKRRSDQLSRTASTLRNTLSSKTDVNATAGFGGSGEAYAGYEMAVRSAYENAWVMPDNTSSDEATATITVIIASDGTVISSSITKPSGDALVDASVQRALDRVKYIAPFPQSWKDSQRTYIIPMNLKSKRLSA